MSRLTLKSEERQFILSFSKQWEELRGAGKERTTDGEWSSPKDDLVDRIIAEFFKKFPYRDSDQEPQNPLVFPQGIRDKLQTKVRRLFYNNPDGIKLSHKSISPLNRHLSYHALIKRKYSAEILDCRDELLKSGMQSDTMDAYNQAVDELKDHIVNKDKKEYQQLRDLAAKARESARLPFHEQDLEVQAIIQDALPGLIVSCVDDWEKRMGARLVVMACWSTPQHQPASFKYASKSCKRFLKSEAGKQNVEIWEQWVQDELGGVLLGDHLQAKPCVWANDEGWPMLPNLTELHLEINKEKQIFQRYISCLCVAYGAFPPSWSKLEEMTRDSPGTAIDVARMPPGIKEWGDMRKWSKATLYTWVRWIIKGQSGALGEHQILFLREVFGRGG
ncbi:hypothetical protein RhiJN_24428 [Ceratobasidium sp. AG-Ba]|nr:hypothetical protein RhiJN_24428 [Ceratobasidium sp. AG-Ba]